MTSNVPEDSALIELTADEKETLASIAVTLGRSPQPVASKVSQPVGVRKMSRNVAGRLIGTFNGAQIEGDLNGTVRLEHS